MSRLFRIASVLIACSSLLNCNAQTPAIQRTSLSDDFDNSPPFYYKMPDKLMASDTSPAFNEKGQKILLTGTVYELDGKTPANDVILYYYQTNNNGVYATDDREVRNMPLNKLGQTHGYIRGWVKTNKEGKYAIYTVQPGSYPSRDEAAHIHISIKEKNENDIYYIDDFVFDNDKLLTTERRKKMENRGGSGVIRFVQKDDIWIGERNIVLGLNIPDYSEQPAAVTSSGKNIGEDIISFTPFHAYGPDKGTKTCPICKYGWYHGILYFVGNKPNWLEIRLWLAFLERESIDRAEYLKVYFVYGNEEDYDKNDRIRDLEMLGDQLDLKQVALTFVPALNDRSSEVHLNRINPNVENTFLVYKRSNIIDKYIDLKPNQENFEKLTNRLEKSTNEYFKLLRPNHH